MLQELGVNPSSALITCVTLGGFISLPVCTFIKCMVLIECPLSGMPGTRTVSVFGVFLYFSICVQ